MSVEDREMFVQIENLIVLEALKKRNGARGWVKKEALAAQQCSD